MSVLSELLLTMAEGRIPESVPQECEEREAVQQLIAYLSALTHYGRTLAAGELSAPLQARGPLAGSLKALHANLRHLTWQTQQVAAGDFTQRVEFLGDFSIAFNTMVVSLAEAREQLVAKNLELARAYEELKAMEASLLQQEKMVSVGQLAAGMAHEINNPLGFIMSNLGTLRSYGQTLAGYVRDLETQAAKLPPAERAAHAELRRRADVDYLLGDLPALIEESLVGVKRVQAIVATLKDFSQVDQAETQELDINDCLETTLRVADEMLRGKAKVVRDFGAGCAVRCRPRELNQLFFDLLRNSADAITNEGEIRVASRRDGEEVEVSVADNGCGIPPEVIARVFEPFFTTKPVGTAKGLGLAMAYDVVKKHHGTIHVVSSVGKGTTVTVRLPALAR